MAGASPSRPRSGEYVPYYLEYIDLVPEGDPLALLEPNGAATIALLRAIPADRLAIQPAPREWSPLDIALHVADTERVMAYRLLWIARGHTTPLPGFDQDAFAAVANANGKSLDEIVEQLATVRSATASLMRSLSAEDWVRTGTSSDHTMSARAFAYVILGHELYHQIDLRKAAS